MLTCFVVCMILYMWLYHITAHGHFTFVPPLLSAWLFRKRGLLITLGAELVTLFTYHSLLFGTVRWPDQFTDPFLINFLVLLVIGTVIDILHILLDQVEVARNQAQQLSQQLSRSYEQERQVNNLKTQLILNLNHEFRTPLTAIIGYLEILQLVMRREGQLAGEKHANYLDQTIRLCGELERRMNTLLDTHILQQQGDLLIFEEVRIAEVVQAVLSQFDPLTSSDYEVQQAIPEQLVVWADQNCLRQILHNLLSNAFKYVPVHSCIRICARLESEVSPEEHSLFVRICVQDNGLGISPQDIPLLFSPFIRLKRELEGPVRGSGLGLYISKNMVEVMQGHIWVESTGITGEGSKFCFTLPCASPHQSSPIFEQPASLKYDQKSQAYESGNAPTVPDVQPLKPGKEHKKLCS
jgi:signal transduction histidine kinase